MELLKLVWTYVIAIWPYAAMLGGTFAGIYFGVKIGYKWGEKDSIRRERTRMWQAIEIRFPRIRAIIFHEAAGKEIPVQGVLMVRPPEPVDIEDGLPFGFRFIPDPKQWEPEDR
jgi:hypothetical protein